MTDQHPLTPKLIDALSEYRTCDEAMRAAADWQLKKVIQAWEQCLKEPLSFSSFRSRFDQKLKAMRPNTTHRGEQLMPKVLPPDYIDSEHTGHDREMLEEFYRACRSEGGSADEIHLRGLKAVIALAQPEPEGVEDRIVKLEADLERERLRLAACSVVVMADTPESAAKARDMSPEYHSASLADVIRQTDALMERRAAIKPVPVSERPWEREGWCDNNGWCWGFDADDTDPFWVFDHPEACGCWTHVLPHYALPIPEPTTQENN